MPTILQKSSIFEGYERSNKKAYIVRKIRKIRKNMKKPKKTRFYGSNPKKPEKTRFLGVYYRPLYKEICQTNDRPREPPKIAFVPSTPLDIPQKPAFFFLAKTGFLPSDGVF